MATHSLMEDLDGGPPVIEWFGFATSFHDAELRELRFSNSGDGLLRIYAWRMTAEKDARGHFICDRYATVTIVLTGVTNINLEDFEIMPGLIFVLEFSKLDELLLIEWSSSYGVHGSVTAKTVQLRLVPDVVPSP